MDENDKKAFLDDFRNADIDQKLDMWFFALSQIEIWDEIMDEMSQKATRDQLQTAANKSKEGE